MRNKMILLLFVILFLASQIFSQSDDIIFGEKSVFANYQKEDTRIKALSDSQIILTSVSEVIAGAVSDLNITWGPPVQVDEWEARPINIIPLSESRFVLLYKDQNTSGVIRVADVSNNEITLGPRIICSSKVSNIQGCYLSSNKIFVSYYHTEDLINYDYGYFFGIISGYNVTMETVYPVDKSFHAYALLPTYGNRFIFIYSEYSGYPEFKKTGKSVIGTVTDHNITFGNEFEFDPHFEVMFNADIFKNQRFIISFAPYSLLIGDVSGTDLIYSPKISMFFEFDIFIRTFCSLSCYEVVSFYSKINTLYCRAGTIDGKDVTWTPEYVVDQRGDNSFAARLTYNKFLITYNDPWNNNFATARIGWIPSAPYPSYNTVTTRWNLYD